MKRILGIVLFTLTACTASSCYAGNEVESLSPELRALLKQEMLAIQQGMQEIVPAMASGDLQQVSKLAGSINKSFILKQKITDSQKHELHKKLPPGFILKDQQFHSYAGMLEHVSKQGHTELVGFYFSRLLESCVGCHSVHATHRFPRFINEPVEKEHQH